MHSNGLLLQFGNTIGKCNHCGDYFFTDLTLIIMLVKFLQYFKSTYFLVSLTEPSVFLSAASQ